MSDPRSIVDGAGMLAEGTFDPGEKPAGIRRIPAGVGHLATEHLVVNVGPQHPSTHGVLRLIVELDGEEIVNAEVVVGYLHRGIEKLGEHRRYHQLGTLMDRGDYMSGIHGELAVALAVERLMDVEAPPKAQWLRSLMSEVNRVASHMVWYGTFGLDCGAMGQFLYAMREREALVDVLEAVTGQRMMFNYVRPGGVVADLPTGAEAALRAFLRTIDGYLDEHDALLGGNEIFQMRVRGIGVIERDVALAFGLTGGNLRASTVPFDVRRDRPYAAYEELDFEIPIGVSGDSWDRYTVRMEEMRQSVRMMRQCLDGMPEGDVMAKVPKVLRPPAGEAYVAVESPRGELGVHLVSDGSDTPQRFRYRPPSLYTLQVLEEILPGCLFADAIMLIGSLDIVLGEIDR
ncbi:MAG: NADH-quinone oxidoreductase subunit D [Clostridiales bacterium]|nr:NADH-quinone oxidoreductase subunit D [Clostridiales bacterium]